MLYDLPIKILKIDRSIVTDMFHNPKAGIVAQSVFAACKSLKIRTVAEGVETKEQADILKEMGLPFYDPLLIIEKTDGRMAGDEQWILILKNKEARHGTDPS